ncbi:MAG: sodium:solute symporter family protein [Cryomorphaceae bacterium]|nr:sodium:solute symporter family protein [Cryomorphaceae bacterium]
MSLVDYIVFIVYFVAIIYVGFYFYKRNKASEDYYVGNRSINFFHIGLSTVATDVGGGFSIGLGGLGFLMGLSGSYLLFTGLIGAWLSAVFLIPKVKNLSTIENFKTFPQFFGHYYNRKVALFAGIISAIGYLGFTSSQLLGGTKLASAAFPEINTNTLLLFMGGIAVFYTVLGGLKAVIYTDTFQWSLLFLGLIFIGIPLSYISVGGWEVISATLPRQHFSLTNVTVLQLINWAVTIIPIWFIGMTLYQRIYAARNEQTAKRAWYLAGILEWPLMAFMGTALGMLGRVAYEQNMFASLGYPASIPMDEEMALPLLMVEVLPPGLMGIMLAAYFSAILSTADSCLMASSGNVTGDIFKKYMPKQIQSELNVGQWVTLIIGALAIVLAWKLENVLSLMLNSYAVMVGGLFVPTIAIIINRSGSSKAALGSIVVGGGVTLLFQYLNVSMGGLDPLILGLSLSALTFMLIYKLKKQNK